ncbi:WXG100 family type VII secretion target [Bacillus albus]|uniref:WXG100 family type VII secretion target n=1 Tax=Bacillus albus TaxID=2026189 RepID=UPI0014197C13|nr:WXG100 family type VII secretion target [Bacillus albus]
MAEIKVTPEELEQVAKTVRNSRNYLEQLHQDLYNQTEYIASMWSGATSEHFYQNFNEAKPKMFTVLMEFDKIAEELEKAADKFRKADEEEQKAMEERIQSKMWTDIAGELSGAYDASRAIDGIDPSTGEKVGWFDRSVAGVMVVGSMLQVGKLGKIPKVAKAADKANEAKKELEAAKTLAKSNKTQYVKASEDGSFSITSWHGYPENGPKPDGPFRLLEGEEYNQARKAANSANRKIHRENPEFKGKQIHEVHPVKYGGSPTDLANKIPLSPTEHYQYNNYWNRLMRELKKLKENE